MIVALSFIGILPKYIIDCIFQLRLFYDGEIYLIIDNLDSPYLKDPILSNVYVVPYEDARSFAFDNLLKTHRRYFNIIDGIGDRRELFIRSMERFFILQTTMDKYNLTDVFFMELDNMMYFDPRDFLHKFSKHDLCYLVDDVERSSSVLMYIKNAACIIPMLDYSINYVVDCCSSEYLNEMQMLYRYYRAVVQNKIPNTNTNSVHILPSFWRPVDFATEEEVPVSENFKIYNGIFDPQPIGIYLCGIDKFHSGGNLKLGVKSGWTRLDYTKYNYEWKVDDCGRKIPYIINETGERIKINNLHVHSKELQLAASKFIVANTENM